MKKTLFKIFDKFIEGVDTYYNNSSMWLIFTDEKKWVIELTKDGTLWYNFYFFKDCFKYLSLDVVENQHYITEWVEDTIQNGVRDTPIANGPRIILVEDTIQNGVRDTMNGKFPILPKVEDTIQNGVRDTYWRYRKQQDTVEDTIQNGIKEINHCSVSNDENAKNAIEFGIKITLKSESSYPEMIEKVIKETHEDSYHNKGRVDGVIRNGIKETKGIGPSEVTTKEIEKVIKETIELPDKSGELNGYGEYYARQKNRTYPHTDIVNDVITDGIKETNWRKVDNHPTYLDHIFIDK